MELEYIDFDSGDVRKEDIRSAKQLSTNIALADVAADGDKLNVKFDYTVSYLPGGGHIRISGKARFNGAESKKAQQEWAKTSRITGKHGEMILNAIHYGAATNAVLLSKAFNLTPPLILPTLKIEPAKAKK